jgi:hypothetical protein
VALDICYAMLILVLLRKKRNDLVEFNLFLNIIMMVHSFVGSTLMLGQILGLGKKLELDELARTHSSSPRLGPA